MNKAQLTSKCHKISSITGLPFNSIMIYYFLESILQKFSQSNYKDNFIFKGGFLLSNLIGISSRSTIDIDIILKNMKITEDNIKTTLNEILKHAPGEDVFYELNNIESIKDEDEYGGFRCKIICKLENIRQVVPLDIATGDIITPEPIDYNYSSSFSDEKINIKAYNLETMLAEKIQTIYSRGFFNSRSKDYYDLFIIRKMKMDKIDIELLKESCKNTFKYRNTEFDMDKILVLLEKIKDDLNFQSRWKSFCKKNIYANGLEFENVIDESIGLIKLMKWLNKIEGEILLFLLP